MRIGLAGYCWDKKSSFMQGPALAPALIKNTLYDGSANDYAENGKNVIESIELVDDQSFDDYFDIQNHTAHLLNQYKKLISLGGDHSITYPIVKAMKEKFGSFDILHFDAHSDTYDNFEGDKYSHACPFARIMEEGLCDRLIQVGIRCFTPHQRDQIDRYGIECIEMKDVNKLKELKFYRPVYISIDLDGFDPAYAPGVSHQEAGGLTPRSVIDFLSTINQPIISGDIVEYNPHRDISNMTASLAAKLVRELGSWMI